MHSLTQVMPPFLVDEAMTDEEMTDDRVATVVVTAVDPEADEPLPRRHDEALPPTADVTREAVAPTDTDPGHRSGEMTDDDRGRPWAVDEEAVEAFRRMATSMRLMLSESMMLSMTTSGVKLEATRGTSRRCRVVFLIVRFLFQSLCFFQNAFERSLRFCREARFSPSEPGLIVCTRR
jgi:hypothetical protein